MKFTSRYETRTPYCEPQKQSLGSRTDHVRVKLLLLLNQNEPVAILISCCKQVLLSLCFYQISIRVKIFFRQCLVSHANTIRFFINLMSFFRPAMFPINTRSKSYYVANESNRCRQHTSVISYAFVICSG